LPIWLYKEFGEIDLEIKVEKYRNSLATKDKMLYFMGEVLLMKYLERHNKMDENILKLYFYGINYLANQQLWSEQK
jgi:hypothetical protein